MFTGEGKKSEITESSGLFVETVEKKPGETKVKRFHGDAGRVVAQGNGLKKGFHGRAAAFTLEVKDAGKKNNISGVPYTSYRFYHRPIFGGAYQCRKCGYEN